MYKCSAQAQYVLNEVKNRCVKDTGKDNVWHGRSGTYMFMMGRENSDGKATGVVHKVDADGSHRLCGSFKILADGTITRFTGISQADWKHYMKVANYNYLDSLNAKKATVTKAKTKAA